VAVAAVSVSLIDKQTITSSLLLFNDKVEDVPVAAVNAADVAVLPTDIATLTP
jgi:hypothetical protein